MKRSYFTPFVFVQIFLLAAKLSAQQENYTYPDTIFPDSIPRIFAQDFISLKESRESGITFSPDGRELFFAREIWEGGNLTSSKIYTSRQIANAWSQAKPASFSGNVNESEPAYSSDGKILYYFSERRKPGITSYIGEIWMVKKKGNWWGEASYPQNLLNANWINSISTTSSGKIYYSAYRNNKLGIYCSEFENEEFSEPVYLPKEINGIAGASHPCVSPDENILVFEGNSTGYSNSELYISFRTSTGIWTPAMKLNEIVNKTGTESNPSISPDGKFLFFTREGDIYWIRLEYVF